MPPKRRPSPEAGEPASLPDDLSSLMRRHGMSPEEAFALNSEPVTLMRQLLEGDDIDDVVVEIHKKIDYYNRTYGPSPDWDKLHVEAAFALFLMERPDDAIALLVGVEDIASMIDAYTAFFSMSLNSGGFTSKDVFTIGLKLKEALIAAGRGQEYMRHAFTYLDNLSSEQREQYAEVVSAHLDGLVDDGTEDEPAWLETKKLLYNVASWPELTEILQEDSYWPDGASRAERRAVVAHFAMLQHHMLVPSKIERKSTEMVKAFVREQEQQRASAVWDRFKFVAAISLYEHNQPNFGRSMTHTMTDPEMIAMVCFALLEHGKDKEALEAAYEIPDVALFGKMLYVGEWTDRAAIDDLLEDITHATVKNNRKYDPNLRVGVAEGLYDLFITRQQEAEAAGDQQVASEWQARAAEMQARVTLLRKQISIKFIAAPRKR